MYTYITITGAKSGIVALSEYNLFINIPIYFFHIISHENIFTKWDNTTRMMFRS